MNLLAISSVILFLMYPGQSTNIPGDGGTVGNLTIGLLLPYSSGWTVGTKIGAAIIVGIEKVNSEGLLHGYNLDYEWRDTKCSAKEGLTGAMDIWSVVDDLDVFIGGGCSVVCEPVALVSAVWNLPHISWGCNSADLSDKFKYPTFSRTVGPWVSLAPMVVDLMNTFQWNRVGIVATTENINQLTANAFRDELLNSGKTVYRHDAKTVMIGTSVSQGRLDNLRGIVRHFKEVTRIVILIMTQRDVNNFLLLAVEEDMLQGDHVFLSIDADPDDTAEGPSNTAALARAYQGFISLNVRKPSGAEWNNFADAVVDRFSTFDNAINITREEVDVHAGMLHDAVLLWAYGVNKTIAQHNASQLDNGTAVTSNLFNFVFEGVSGHVVIDGNGDRKPDYSIQILQNGTFVTLLDYIAVNSSLNKIFKPSQPNDWTGIEWANYRTSVPKDEPKCGWDNEHCSKTTLYVIIGVLLLVLIAVLIIIFLFLRRKFAYEREVYNRDLWKISWNDVQQNQIISQIASQRAALQAKKTMKSLGHGQDTLSRTIVGKYKGNSVAIKQLNRSSIDIDQHGRKLLVEIKQIRDLKHENVNNFVGACVDAPHVCILMAYCSKGSLQEVLHNDSFVLTWDFRTSLANDIAKGMHYLHRTPLKSHGCLTSNNVIIDSRWVAKVTDYGFSAFKEGMPERQDNKLWMAPEILKAGDNRAAYGTQAGDVYSFGIILSEIATRDLPFSKNSENYSIPDILDRVSRREWPPYRPVIPPETCSQYWIRLMTKCWDENPANRLCFRTIKLRIKEINGGKDINVLDNMLCMLEQHSEQLEEVLEEKSTQLECERQKCEVLLLTRLPREIKARIEEDDIPEAETFRSVTVLQTGIHNFDKMLAKCSPSDVCYLLSTLWWKMDSLCTIYDVFKSDSATSDGETIIGKLSKDEGVESAEHLAAIALKMLCEMQSIHVPFLEERLLPWKAALHTGQCIGVVVGQRVPRYSVFGNATITASKLLKHSIGLRILISDKTKRLLGKTEGLHFVVNESHDTKEIDTKSSYWLKKNLEVGQERPPNPDRCASFSNI